MMRLCFHLVTGISLTACVMLALFWRRGLGRGDHGFDLVRWNGNENGFLDYGVACHPDGNLLDLRWIRIRGGFTPTGVVDESAAFDPKAFRPDGAGMPGVGDNRAFNAPAPGHWTCTNHVWDFNLRDDDYVDSRPPLLDTRWGLRADVEKAAWDVPYQGGKFWERVTFRIFVVPFWLTVALTFLLPMAWLCVHVPRATRRWRYKPGFCPACGYDLRATRERCPECGNRSVTRWVESPRG
jgi:hypothetical protein